VYKLRPRDPANRINWILQPVHIVRMALISCASSSSVALQSEVDPGHLLDTSPSVPVSGCHPPIPTSSSTPSSHLNLGRPHLLCPPGLPSRTFLGGSLSSIRATCPAHLSLADFTIPITDESPYKSYNSLLNRSELSSLDHLLTFADD
jgi:hypothetical protein